MSVKRKVILSIQCLFIVLALIIPAQPVYAAVKQVEILTTDRVKDLTVMFSFDKEVVDITFISPSGDRKSVGDSDVSYASGDLWSTYRITDAEAGAWSVEYDLKQNSEIAYSVIEDDYGLWIQYVNVTDISDEKASLAFEADCESSDLYYNYELYVISAADGTVISKISDGSAAANEEKQIEVALKSLSSGNYIFRLDVYSRDGEAELFDSLASDPFEYHNPEEPNAIEDFKVLVDLGNLTCNIDWSDFVNWGYDGYRLTVSENDEIIYTGELERDVTSDGVMFSSDATTLEIKLSYQDNNIWSTERVKTVNLENEFLKMQSGDVTNSAQVTLAYQTAAERKLYVNINGEEGNYQITENGNLSFDLSEGSNTIYAEMECDELVSFMIDSAVYYDIKPPEIKLYDDLDGKTFYTDSVTIIGTVTGGNVLTIADETVEMKENGEFSYEAALSLGENIIIIEAQDVNGNSTRLVLTLYKASRMVGGTDAQNGLVQFLPLVAAGLTSILIIVLSVAFMRKKVKTTGDRKRRIWPFILWDIFLAIAEAICIWQFISRYLYCNSMNFLEFAERSVSEAARYLRWERIFGIASGVILLIFIISVLLTIFRSKRNKKNKIETKKEA